MLRLLSITNFATIERLEMELAPGFNVLTGETGVGKSIIVDALILLLGGRADGGMVRTGARQSRIEGIFLLNGDLARKVNVALDGYEIAGGEEEIILAREVNLDEGNTCRMNGRIVSLRLVERPGRTLGGHPRPTSTPITIPCARANGYSGQVWRVVAASNPSSGPSPAK